MDWLGGEKSSDDANPKEEPEVPGPHSEVPNPSKIPSKSNQIIHPKEEPEVPKPDSEGSGHPKEDPEVPNPYSENPQPKGGAKSERARERSRKRAR